MLADINNHMEVAAQDCHIWQNQSNRMTKIGGLNFSPEQCRYIFITKTVGDLDY